MLARDIKFGFRILLKNYRITFPVLLSLSLVIAINTSMFSFVEAVLLRPLPYERPRDLIMIWGTKDKDQRRALTTQDLESWKSEVDSITDIAPFQMSPVSFSVGSEQKDEAKGGFVSSGAFNILGAKAELGRIFSKQEERDGERLVILSHGLWKNRYGGATNALGMPLYLNGIAYRVVGVMQPDFFFPDQQDEFWLPLSPQSGMLSQIQGIARLKPFATLQLAQQQLDTAIRSNSPEDAKFEAGIFDLYETVLGKYETALWTLLGGVGLLLLIACGNAATLLIVLGKAREKELAVRRAIGASRANIVCQLLIESTILSAISGATGLALTYVGIRLLRGMTLADIPRIHGAAVNVKVMLFCLAISCLAGVIAGIVPAWKAAGESLVMMLQQGGIASYAHRRRGVRNLAVMAEIALALTLSTGAGLLIKSFVRISRANWGFSTEKKLAVFVGLPREMRFATLIGEPRNQGDSSRTMDSVLAQQEDFITSVIERTRRAPAILSMAVSPSGVPGRFKEWSPTMLALHGRAATIGWRAGNWRVGPNYFRSIGIQLLVGREFDARDNRLSSKVVIVSKTLAHRLWPSQSALGQQLQILELKRDDPAIQAEIRAKMLRHDGSLDHDMRFWQEVDGQSWTVIGVVDDVMAFGLDQDPDPALYVDYSQWPSSMTTTLTFIISFAGDPKDVVALARDAITIANSKASIREAATMSEIVQRSSGGRGTNKLLFLTSVTLGILAVVLAGGGIYSTISNSVSRRTREIGIRRALGATPITIIVLVLRENAAWILTGLLLGTLGAFGLSGLLGRFLYGVSATDPFTFFGIVLLFVMIAVLACLIPTVTAVSATLADALRQE